MSQSLAHSTTELVEHLRVVFDRSPLPTAATEGRAHVLRYLNPAFGTLVGKPVDGLLGNPLAAADAAVALLDRILATGSAERALDLARLIGTDRAASLPCAVWPIVGVKGQPAGLLVLANAPTSPLPADGGNKPIADELRDVNERLLLAGLIAQEQAEVQITLRNEAEAALAMRDEFLAIAAHELRTPVTGVKTSAQLALRSFGDAVVNKAQIERYLVGILGGANRLVALINDLMDVSRMRPGELQLNVTPVNLSAVVKTVVLRYIEMGDEHHITTDLPASTLVVAVDSGRLEQILINLLSNAVKYSPAGGEIRVKLRQVADGIELTVSDDGIGLPPGAAERIFEPFGRAANARRMGLPGMGLGLHICRRIAEAHGGRMWATSHGEGRGVTVGLWLPLG